VLPIRLNKQEWPAHWGITSVATIRQVVPPHPVPLPMGEGETSSAVVAVLALGYLQTLSKGLPSPWGEGKGEGDSGIIKPNVFRFPACEHRLGDL